MNPRTLALAALAATLAVPASADDGWYGGVQFGQGNMSEAFAPMTPQPMPPPYSYSVCGGTATLQPLFHPQVTSIEASATAYQFFVGRRFGGWAFELGSFNVARLEEHTKVFAAPTQPTCSPPAADFFVDGEAVGLVSYAFEGYAISPVYTIPLSADSKWMIDVRATIAFWDGEERSQYQLNGHEFSSTETLQRYNLVTNNAERHTDGIDLGVGLGMSYQLRDTVRVRGIYEQQAFGDVVVQSWLIGVAIDFQ